MESINPTEEVTIYNNSESAFCDTNMQLEQTRIGTRQARPIRTSSRAKQPPIWLKDFVSLSTIKDISHAISNYVSYEQLSPKYQVYLSVFLLLQNQAASQRLSKILRWIQAIKLEIEALQNNNTWSIIELPEEKKPIGYK